MNRANYRKNRVYIEYSNFESMLREILSSCDPITIEEKVLLLRDIFLALAPLRLDAYAINKIILSAKILGLRSGRSFLVDEYKKFLKDHQNSDFKS